MNTNKIIGILEKMLGKIDYENKIPKHASRLKNIALLDSACVMMIRNKNEAGLKILKLFLREDDCVPNIKNNAKLKLDKGKIGGSKYNIEYLDLAFEILTNSFSHKEEDNTSIFIQTGKDYPIVMSNNTFEIIIAPRVEKE